MKIRLAADIQSDSIVDGEGIRAVIWTQGCPHNCKDCHNPETHDFEGGAELSINYVKKSIDGLKGQDGLTFSGGDPFCQPLACSEIARYARSKGLNIWCYTGYEFEKLMKIAETKKDILKFLNEIDVLVDGKFVLDKKSFTCIFRGSSNQRIIDVKESLKNNKVVLVEKYYEENSTSNRQKNSGIYI